MATGTERAGVAGTGRYLPPDIVDNYELFSRPSIQAAFDHERARGSLRDVDDVESLSPADVFDRWARQLTGIQRRRFVNPDSGPTSEEMCAEAGRLALEQAGMPASELDLIIVASLTAADIVPNAACTVASLLGAPQVGGFVLNTACAGFISALAAGDAFIHSGAAENVLVVSGDALSKITNYSDPTTAVLFADGAGAMVLTRDRSRGAVLGPAYLSADYAPEHLHLGSKRWLSDEDPEAILRMGGGPHVLKQAIQTMVSMARYAMEGSGVSWDDVDYVIPHQANLRITTGLERQLKLNKGRVIHTIQNYGNVSASTVPIALDELLRGEHGPLPDPARIVLTAVGGGYASGAVVIESRPAG
ncbi:MAG: beta-ketoacyl-ACP synthase 3 [Gemmatimonadota bacterium]